MAEDIALTDGDVSQYKRHYKYRGRALIIVNIDFKRRRSRLTAEKDIGKMACMFRALDFKVTVFKNLTATAMREKIERAAEDPHNTDSECFALVISSHGGMMQERQKNKSLLSYTISGTEIDDDDCDFVDMSEIMSYFQDSNAPGLKGKPKLFFIQACRHRMKRADESKDAHHRDMFDKGITISVEPNEGQTKMHNKAVSLNLEDLIVDTNYENVNDGWMNDVDKDEYKWEEDLEKIIDNPDSNPCDTKDEEDTESLPPSPFDLVLNECMPDCIIVYATVSGKSALRDDYGSVLLHFLYLNSMKLLCGCGLLEYLSSVVSDICKEDIKNIYKMTPCIVHRLTAKVTFEPKVDNSYMTNVRRKNKL